MGGEGGGFLEVSEWRGDMLIFGGRLGGAPFDSHPDEAFAKVMDLNVRGVFNIVRECAPLLGKRGTIADPSRVLITASVAGLGVGSLGENGTYGYSASKAAAIHLGRNLAVELGPRHMYVLNSSLLRCVGILVWEQTTN